MIFLLLHYIYIAPKVSRSMASSLSKATYLKYDTNYNFNYTSLDPALPGSIMHREGSNILRCKTCFNNCTPKKVCTSKYLIPLGA